MWFLACVVPEPISLGAGAAGAKSFDASCTYATDGAHEFMLCTDRLGWVEAQDACAAEGWHLADVDDASENAWLSAELLALDAANPWWIGLHDRDAEGAYTWDGGSTTAYTNWRAGEPNNYGGNEDCVRFAAGSSQWADADCTALAPYACETGCLYTSSWWDDDGDGLGGEEVRACGTPAGAVDNADDCDDGDDTVGAATPWYADLDGDSHGAGTAVLACEAPAGHVASEDDCDDTSAEAHPGAAEAAGDGLDQDCDGADTCAWYRDADGDGYGDAAAVLTDCAGAAGYVADATDCEDADAAVHPAADEVWYDGTDQDCDGNDDDQDGDGVGVAADCDEHDAAVFPGATEACNGGDDDCDGLVDDATAEFSEVEGAACEACVPLRDGDHLYLACDDALTWAAAQAACAGWGYHLADVDDSGDEATILSLLDASVGWWIGLNDLAVEGTWAWDGGSTTTYTHWRAGEPNSYGDEDCVRYPAGATEWVDSACTQSNAYLCELGCVYTGFYADSDGDGAGDLASEVRGCTAEAGYVANAEDCDDADPSVTTLAWYADLDGDGAGAGAPSLTCDAPAGYVARGDDCDDADPSRSPTLPDVAGDGLDQDCDGVDSCAWYEDADGDGYGNPAVTIEGCDGHAGYAPTGTDCDDTSAAIHPGAAETWYDGIDQDCDGVDDDQDGDGFPVASDCVDTDPLAFPEAEERCNGQDDDCDLSIDEWASDPKGLLELEGQACGCWGERSPDGERLYLYCEVPATWEGARVACEDAGYTFLALGTREEDAFTRAIATGLDSGRQWWFGLSDRDAEGTFAWSNGQTVTWTDWAAGEPNDFGGGEDCGRWSTTTGWSDGDCTVSLPYVCELGCETTNGWVDADGDGWGGQAVESCEATTMATRGGDCADDDPTRSPAATEVCDDADVDEDCDGVGDEAGATGETTWYPDVDADGWGAGTSAAVLSACDAPEGYVAQSGDCDDASATQYPGAPEGPDELDNDCDGYTELEDPDEDGLSTAFEQVAGCDPHRADTDGDGRSDSEEGILVAGVPRDADKDGVPDCADADRACGCGAGPYPGWGALSLAPILVSVLLRRRAPRSTTTAARPAVPAGEGAEAHPPR